MPRYDKQRTSDPVVPESKGPTVGLGVAASPVSLQVRQSGGDEAFLIADALKGLVPALAVFGQQRAGERNKAEMLAGAKARDEQDGRDLMPQLREQSSAFQSGYMRQHGLRMSILDGEETERQYELHKNDPDFNREQFFASRRQEGLKGMSDPDAYETYAANLFRTEAKLRSENTKEEVQKVRAEEAASRQVEIAAVQKDISERSVAAAGTSLDAFMANHYAKGTPYDVSRGEWVANLVNNPEAKPQDYEHLYQPDSSGIAPVDRPDARGVPYRVHVDNAKKAAQKREDAKWDKQLDDNARTFLINHDFVLRTDPMSITNPYEYVAQNSHVWKTGESASSALNNILKAQDEYGTKQLKLKALAGAAPLARAMASDKDVIDMANQQYYASWATVDWANPDSVTSHLERSTNNFAKWGIPDPFIKSMSERVKTMTLVKDASGKDAVSPEFQAAYSMYKSLKDTGNQQLSQFDDDSRVMLHTFENAPGTAVERFQAAATAIDPEAKQRIKKLWLPEERSGAVNQYAGKFAGRFSGAANGREVSEQMVSYAELLMARGGSMTQKVALESAYDKFVGMYANDGHGSLARIPQDVPRQQAEVYLKQYIGDAKAMAKKQGKELGEYVVAPTMWNGKTAFTLKSPLGVDLVPPRTVDELQHDVLRAEGKAPEQTVANQNAQQARAIAGPRRDRAWAIQQLNNGAITSEEYDTVMKDADEREALIRRTHTSALKEAMLGAPQLAQADTADSSVRIPVPQPFGPEQTPKDIALDRAKTDPFVAITAYGEGFRNKLFDDPNQKDKLIGFGYNISARSEEKVRADFAKAGITDPERQSKVLKGEDAITPDEAARLANLVKQKSAAVAIRELGQKVWDALPDFKRAVLIDLAYQAGDSSSAFRSALSNLSKGNEAGVKAALQVSYFKEKDQKRVMDSRRNNLRLALWESPERFQQLVSSGV